MESLTKVELLKVLKEAKAHSIRNWCMILTAFHHGLRASEVCNLVTSDIKDGSHIRVKRLKGSNTTTHQFNPYKGEPLLDEIKAMKQWLAERPTDAGAALFPSNKGGCMSATQFYRIYRAIAEAVGLPVNKQHPHVLKHTCCTQLVKSDMNVAKVAAFVGHAAIASTMKYVRISDEDASAEAAQRLMMMK
jgi:site-specific recombinase XerD